MAPSSAPNPMDLGMDAAARDASSIPLTIGAVLDLAGAVPSLEDLREHVAASLSRLPTLTHHLAGPRLRARWVHDPLPNLEVRVRERVVEAGGLDAALDELIALPLPDSGPPWDLWLLRGHATGTYTLCYRASHTTHDGIGLRNTLYALFGGATPDAPHEGRATAASFARALRAQLGSLTRAEVWNDPATPLTGERTRGWAHVSTELLRKKAAAAGGSSNDASLACLAYALREWTTEHWPRGRSKRLSTVVMVDGRSSEEWNRPGNLFAFAPINLPCHLPTFDEQLAAVIAATRSVKHPSMRRTLRTLMERTPARSYYAAARKLTTPERATVDTSHVAFHHPLRHGNAPVTSVRMFTWLPQNHPLSLISCSYAGTTSVHFVSDAALPGLADLPRRWTAALDAAGSPPA
ncbi:wax ester/triacylglycerol synthase domain-containing protein [Streptomyces sp. AS58]|uniref:wax ester/triacylglycerol synthase domain-containing protein n=1 Tax=Streptomyces sp. AS58 TaxID=1519489 RepID=UPI00099C1C01|nr:wax ester/triacylglycerol synthase domain-containing protein [Streptomyces sp. AS58]